VLRTCVHCGFCTATCPTYQVLGDELDSPRGRIYLIKDMLENGRKPDAKTVKHIDRCLSCLACMTTCPSGVHYMHLVDHAREYIEQNYDAALGRPRAALAAGADPALSDAFRLAFSAPGRRKPFAPLLPRKLRAMVEFAPARLPPVSRNDVPQVFPRKGERRSAWR
jgi:glycolate oxidase iron-sulfur subunit